MAPLHRILYRATATATARRHFTSRLISSSTRFSSPPQLGFLRPFSSDPSPSPSPPPIKPVSYSPKPKSEEAPEEKPPPADPQSRTQRTRAAEAEGPTSAEPRGLTREDIRYVKDVPSISPVSYPSRVAPLPEHKVSPETAAEEVQELQRERRRIEKDAALRRAIRGEEEKVLPFPTLMKVEKRKPKVVLDLQEAIREVKANAKWNFDETIEAHVNLGVDGRRGDQMVRGSAVLPHGTGKTIRIAVFAEGAAADEARAAGADIVGGEELVEEIKKGGSKLNFDKCISTPSFMPRLGKISKILGPRGLMPNPRLGSVTSDVTVAVKAAKHGRIDFKIDKTAIVHVGLGKISFPEDSIRENVGAFMNALLLAKPVGLKKTSKYAGYVNSFTICSTMGPGFPVSIQSLSIAADHYNKLQLK